MVFKSFIKNSQSWLVFLSFFLLGMAASPPLVGGPAPHFELKNINGQKTRLSDFNGRFVILNFWATWCVPCIKEMPELQKAHLSLNGKVKIIGINLAESREKVEEFIKTHHLSFPILLDSYGNVSQDYEVVNLPITYLITPDGFVREKIFGVRITQKIIKSKIMMNAK